MNLSQLLKLAEEFENVTDSLSDPSGAEEAAYFKRTEDNNLFAEKKRKEAVSTCSSLVSGKMGFDVQIVDKGPDSEGTTYCSIAVVLKFSDLSEAKMTAKKIFQSLKASDDSAKISEQDTDVGGNWMVLVIDYNL